MASGWNLCVWLECIGVVVRRYIFFIIAITYPYSTLLYCSFFAAASIPTSLFIFKCFLFLFMLVLCNIANVAQRTLILRIEIFQKSRSREHGGISTRTYTHTLESRDFHVRGTA